MSVATDLVMALSQQQVTASNSLVSCSNVIACCCCYQTPATFMSRLLSLPYSNPREPLQSKHKLHEQCRFFGLFLPRGRVCEAASHVMSYIHKLRNIHVLQLPRANLLLLVLTTESPQCCKRRVGGSLKDSPTGQTISYYFT